MTVDRERLSRPRPVCMVVHSYYEEDPRVRREAEALVARGRQVDVFALRRPGDQPEGFIEGVRLTRIDVQRHQGAGLGVYLFEYLAFLVRASLRAARAHRLRRYGLVQVHSLPDFLVFAALPLKLAGVPVVLDLHEAMPVFFKSRFPRADHPFTQRALLLQERLSIAFADAVITVNDAVGDRLLRLGLPAEKLSIVPNSPDLTRFDPAAYPRRGFREDGSLRIIYTGALTPMYELDVAVEALGLLATERPDLDARLDFYGRGDVEFRLGDQAAALGLADRVTFHGRIPLEDVPAAVAAADLGIAPSRRDPFTALALSTKALEYAAMRKPVVATRLPLVEGTFGNGTVLTYRSGDAKELAAAIARLADDPLEREARVARTERRVHELDWARDADRYATLIDRLARGQPARASRAPGTGT